MRLEEDGTRTGDIQFQLSPSKDFQSCFLFKVRLSFLFCS